MGDNNEEKVNSNCKKCSIASGVFSGGITGAIFGVFKGGAIGTAGQGNRMYAFRFFAVLSLRR